MNIIVENDVLTNVEVDYEKDVDIKEFAIPDGVVELAPECLAYLPMGIETLYIPKTVKKIHISALFGEAGNWENLKNIVVEEGNKNYKSESGCLIEVITNAVILGTEDAVIPNGVQSIGFYAFRQRENLKQITIPESVKKVDMQAFACCRSLKKVTVLGKDTNLDSLCFITDTAIEEFNLPKDSNYEFIDGCLIKKTGNVLLLVTDKGKIPSTVKSVENYAIVRYFNDIEIPETVEKLSVSAVLILGGNKLLVNEGSKAEEYAKLYKIPYEII